MANRRLYSTKARTSPSLVLRAYNLTYKNGNMERDRGNIIAGVQKFSRKENKQVKKRKSLGKRGMRPFQVIPQSIDTSLTLSRIVFYRNSYLKDIGDIDNGLFYQTKPLMIQETQHSPLASLDLYEYHDCWFTSNPIEYNVSGNNITMSQSISVECAYMIPKGGKFGGIQILEEPQQLLQSNISI